MGFYKQCRNSFWWWQKKKNLNMTSLFINFTIWMSVTHCSHPAAGQHSSSFAAPQSDTEQQPCLTLPIPAQVLVTHGPHPASVYCFQSRQFPCHAWRIASSSVYFSAAAHSRLPGSASLLTLFFFFSHHIESGCDMCLRVFRNQSMCVRVLQRRRWRACAEGRGCFGTGNLSKRVIEKRTWWGGWRAISAYWYNSYFPWAWHSQQQFAWQEAVHFMVLIAHVRIGMLKNSGRGARQTQR